MDQHNSANDILETNQAWWDRLLRFVIGGGLVALASFHIIGAWGYLGLILLLTSFLGYCPIYHYTGRSTYCPRAKSTTSP
ncbi:MAG: DUF2892 domain-containing protein [Ferrovum sp.]|nr:DUF2892 domain-containing protein [Ferrovum sp.]